MLFAAYAILIVDNTAKAIVDRFLFIKFPYLLKLFLIKVILCENTTHNKSH